MGGVREWIGSEEPGWASEQDIKREVTKKPSFRTMSQLRMSDRLRH